MLKKFLKSRQPLWLGIAWAVLIATGGEAINAADEAAPKLRYDLKSKSVFAYEISITADRPDLTDDFHGVVTYTVKNVDSQQIDVNFTGNLGRKQTQKASQSSPGRRRGGPRGRPSGSVRPGGAGGPGGPRGPLFGQGPMTGLTRQSNDIRMTTIGEFVSLKGTSQLPYLLGNLSLLPFENFPEKSSNTWAQNFGALMTEAGDTSRIPGPRFRTNDASNDKTTSGGSSIKYAIEKRDGPQLTIRRVSSLKFADSENKGQRVELALDGKLEFNVDQSLTTSSELKGKLAIQVDNVSVSIPLTIKLKLLTEDERKQHEDKQKAAHEERLAKLKEIQTTQQKKLAAPLTAKERADIIATLKSGRPANVSGTLSFLNKRTPTKDDKDIAKAIQQLLTNSNGGIRRNASTAWAKWSTLLIEGAGTSQPAGNSARRKRPSR
jgi:transcriptional regulator of met regulon